MSNKKSQPFSLYALIAAIGLLYAAGFVYYPKYKNTRTEATISWDVSGYYMYLPAIFIYKDIKKQQFLGQIIDQYHPTPNNIQSFKHESGNYVMKYSAGQAVTLSPFFAAGHLWAKNDSRYSADGFSYPYQLSIALGCFLIAVIGLIYLRKVLLVYFSESISAMVLICIVFGSNYLEYAGISSGMTHNALFTYYALLLWNTIQFHKSPKLYRALILGVLIGIMALTRPTEILAALIPMLWGIDSFTLRDFKNRIQFFIDQKRVILPAIIVTGCIGFIQLAYWKYASGDWIVYSYQEEGFSWLSPHVWDCMFSYRSGWLIYSPMMIFSLIGLFCLWSKRHLLFWSIISFCILFVYVTFAWDVWWYGGALGQRAMVQSYPVLGLGIGGFLHWIKDKRAVWKSIVGVLMILFIYLNLFWTHQSHKGGMLHVGEMTQAYFWKVIGKTERVEDDLKLLDTEDNFKISGPILPKSINISDTLTWPIRLSSETQFSSNINIDPRIIDHKYIRIIADLESPQKEWDKWKMAQMVCKFTRDGKDVKYSMIRLYRLLNHGDRKKIHMDVKVPRARFDEVRIYFWNAGGDKDLIIHDVEVEQFDSTK